MTFTKPSHSAPANARRGVALVIILAFIVLLTGLLVAFFARVTNERNVANSSSNIDKADLMARSAVDIIVGDLKQEIAIGSAYPTGGTAGSGIPVGTGTTASVIYPPLAPANAVPIRSGDISAAPNLIRRSIRTALAGTATVSLASPVNSAADVSSNGRSVSAARWNSHYLIPRPAGAANTDHTPIAAFVAPDWVMVNRSGPQNATPPTTLTALMRNSTSANKNYILGRYAFAIYDEGGLLDANVAGYPSGGPATLSFNRKGSAAFADLSQLMTTGANPTSLLSASQIDGLVGWRYHASTQPQGSYPTYSFNNTAATSFFNLVTGTLNGAVDKTNAYARGGYMMVSNSTLSGQTDQAFGSRAQLIRFSQSQGYNPDVLQYLGTFSRDVEQPSYIPNPARPRVQAGATAHSTAVFGAGNTAYGADTLTQPATNINPPFLQVRVATAFTRPDGTSAKTNDPLVAKRFPLSRLNLITSSKTNSKVQTDEIFRNFGLYRTDATKNWAYDHGGSTKILRLDDVKSLQREPDFFELLKAAINVGSIAKGLGNNYNSFKAANPYTAGYLQDLRDSSTDLQILQIGANIIDQSKADNFPTRIQFAGSNNYEVRGVEDLPYLYRWRNWAVRTGPTTGVLMWQPELWNPHSRGSSTNVTALATPKSFRVRMDKDSHVTTNTPISITTTYSADHGSTTHDFSAGCTFDYGNVLPPPLTFNAGELNSFWGFREPTLLGQIGVPAGSNLNCTASYTDYPSSLVSHQRTGIKAADFPWANPSDSSDLLHNLTEGGDPTATGSMPNNSTAIRYFLEYQDSSGNWITYDDQFVQIDGSDTNGMAFTDPDPTSYQKPTFKTWGAARIDPRTSRWGMRTSEYINLVPQLDATLNTFSTYRPDSGIGYGQHTGGWADAGIVGGASPYGSVYTYQGFQSGYWEENSTRPTYQTMTDGTGQRRYSLDPDGVPRRAMGGYTTDTTNGGSITTASAPGTLLGLPLATAMTTGIYSSRPTILHRPFQSVGELGYVFRDMPWGDLNFSFPESGDSALLDVFCINENTDLNGLVAGRVNLNTRQAPVIQALLSNALRDKDDSTNPVLPQIAITAVAAQLVKRTMNTATPPTGGYSYGALVNRGDLVGTYKLTPTETTPGSDAATKLKTAIAANSTNASQFNLSDYYTGFSADIGLLPAMQVASGSSTNQTLPASLIPRQRESVIRALADAGTTRTWNLMIDVVAQSGRYSPNATTLANFVVEGETRYWLHVAIDRTTGQVLDRQLELVEE